MSVRILPYFSFMTIYIDADAFPNRLKDIVYRASKRTGIPLVLVACQYVRVPESPLITSLEIEAGPDAADDWIAERVAPGDLVITQDIPLADRVVSSGASAIDPRGEFYTASNIKDRLATRNLLEGLRTEGLVSGGPPPFSHKNAQIFANSLDRFLTGAANRNAGSSRVIPE